jgi:hypothetical protein
MILMGSVDNLCLFPAPPSWTTVLRNFPGACLFAICRDWRKSSRYASRASQAVPALAYSVLTIND